MKNEKGFTLIELTIGIVIIGILLTIVIPNFLNAKDKTKITVAGQAVNVIRTALEMYRVDKETYPIVSTPLNLLDSSKNYLVSKYITNPQKIKEVFQNGDLDTYSANTEDYVFSVTAKDRSNPYRTILKATPESIYLSKDGGINWKRWK